MLAPQIFVLPKLYQNLRHPIYEWIHTRHEQLPLEKAPNIHLVKHYLFSRLVTVYLIKEVEEGRRGEYYGHCNYFPQTFNLIKRIYVEDDAEPNLEEYIEDVLHNQKI